MSDIHSVQPSASHPHGGELITITGVGLSGGMAVDIDGIPCKVIHSSFSEIKCVTGAAPSDHPAVSEDGTYPSVQEGYRFKGELSILEYVHFSCELMCGSCVCVCRWPRCYRQGVSGNWQK